MVAVTREEPPCPATSAGDGGGGTRPEETGIPDPAGAAGVSVDVRPSDVSPGEEVGVGIVVSGDQEPGLPGDTNEQERRGGNEVQGGNPNTSREIVIPSWKGNAHERSPVSRERSPVTHVPAPDVSQKSPCCSTNLSHNTQCRPSPQKQIRTTAHLRETTCTPLLHSRPVPRSSTELLEGAKREEGGENAVIFLWGSRDTGTPLSPAAIRASGPKWPRIPDSSLPKR